MNSHLASIGNLDELLKALDDGRVEADWTVDLPKFGGSVPTLYDHTTVDVISWDDRRLLVVAVTGEYVIVPRDGVGMVRS